MRQINSVLYIVYLILQDLKVVLMKLLKQKLGKKLTSQAEAAWSKTIDVAYQVIFEGLKTSDVASVK